jgi:GxxExxY protein
MRRYDSSRSPETHAIIGAAIEVQRHFGTGLLESAYGDALELELADRGIPHFREVAVPLVYKGRTIRTCYRADFVCHGSIILELKASVGLGNADQAQMWHYLAATGLTLGLLLNFGHSPMQIRRFANGFSEPVSLDFADSAAG